MELPEGLSPEEAVRITGSLLARFRDAGWLESYSIREGTMDVRFTDLGSRRISELYQIFHGELPKVSNRELPALVFLALHYGSRIAGEQS